MTWGNPLNQSHQVLECFLVFNKSVSSTRTRRRTDTKDKRNILRTNFYTPTKVALSFRMKPDFLSEAEYGERPFGIFLVIGNLVGFGMQYWIRHHRFRLRIPWFPCTNARRCSRRHSDRSQQRTRVRERQISRQDSLPTPFYSIGTIRSTNALCLTRIMP